jgi:hypothetical protein
MESTLSTIYGLLLRGAAVAAAGLALACSGGGQRRAAEVGFWFETRAFTVSPDVVARLEGPVTNADQTRIEQIASAEIHRAFAGLRIAITTRRDAMWRVHVLETLPVRFAQQLPNAGESVALGPFGGSGTVDFNVACQKAIAFAPAGTMRPGIVDAVGRGIGRTAVHEFMHLMLGARAADNRTDEQSYEFHSADRAAHYYGELHWTSTWPAWQQRFGR